MNTFHLKRYAIGRQPSVELTREEYDVIVRAQRHSFHYLGLEELFDLVMGNYEEFERELLVITLRDAAYLGALNRWDDAIGTIQLIARRFANMLTTAHGYCDQVPHVISALCGPESEELRKVRAFFRHEHSTVLGYRVCVELRRYMQHRSTAVHGFVSTSRWVERGEGRRVRVNAYVPQVNVRRLQEDPKFKASVLAELADGGSVNDAGDRIHDLRLFVRQYLSALGRVHLKVRELLAARIVADDSVVEGAVARFCALPDAGKPIGLAVVELNERGLIEDRRPVFVMAESIERRRRLAEWNHLPAHFHTQVITNEIDA